MGIRGRNCEFVQNSLAGSRRENQEDLHRIEWDEGK